MRPGAAAPGGREAQRGAPPAGPVRPPAGWAGAAAAFDARVFGPDAWPASVWRYELSDGAAGVYLAFVDGDGPHASAVPGILALGGVSPGPEAEILTIGVAESWRGRGLGGRLLDELVSAAVREGAETVFLEVRSRSEGARARYDGRGFVPVGLRRRYYRDDDALVMRRDVRR